MILHVDMDAFYASVEERDRPELAGQPLIVGGSRTGRGVVAAANYAARTFGIHSAMPAAQAFRACPELISIRPRMSHYVNISRQIREIFFRFTPLVEPLSLDEAFLDVTGCEELFGTGPQIARQVKAAIKEETGLIASVGVAPNKFLAKIASDLQKPDGLVVVDPQSIQEFLDPLPIGRIWGVGKVTQAVMQRINVATIGDLRRQERSVLERHFGSHGGHFHRLAHGIDDRKVVPDREAKSISHERTFETDLVHLDVLRAWALELTEQVGRRLRRNKLRARTIHIKVRFADFKTLTRSQTLKDSTNLTNDLWNVASTMLNQALPGQHAGIRLLGMGVSHFEKNKKTQQSLFDGENNRKQQRLDTVADQIQSRFGTESLARGSGMIHMAARKHRSDDSPSHDSQFGAE